MSAPAPTTRAAHDEAPFGTLFAPRMSIAWFREGAWTVPEITEVAPLPLHPGSHVLHYASACFEGLKAFRRPDGEIHLFRLDAHAARMLESAELLCLPVPELDTVRDMIVSVVSQSRDEVPDAPGALYLRPTMIGTEVNVGAAGTPPSEVCLYVLASPVGDYFAGGLRPLTIYVEDEQPRTTESFGMAKTGANYASALRHVIRAREEHGADTVLFCPGGDVQETGASNFLLVNDEEILTKPLDTSYLHGVTRDSILALGRDLGYRVTERDFTVEEMREWVKTGEAALSGTAAVLGGVGTLVHRGERVTVADGDVGPNTRRLRDALTAIQLGQTNDSRDWLTVV